MTKPTLWIVGDSFSQPRKEYNGTNPLVWTELVAEQLGCNLVNESFYGVSQDFCWLHLQIWIQEKKIKPEDYVMVVMTHPNRFWYVEDKPDLANALWTINLDEFVTKEQANAIRGFVNHIQRPELDSIHLVSRMGWLGYARVLNKIRRPLVIKAFNFDLLASADYPDINIAQGHLYELQTAEFPKDQQSFESVTHYFNGADPRYNHLSLVNHPILATAVADALRNDTALDLNALPILTEILPDNIDDDLEFAQREFNPELWQHHVETKKRIVLKSSNLTGWLKGVKLNK